MGKLDLALKVIQFIDKIILIDKRIVQSVFLLEIIS